jgi:hypothetical protein
VKAECRKESTLDYTPEPKPAPQKRPASSPVIAAKERGRRRLGKILEMIRISITDRTKQPEIKAGDIFPVHGQKPVPGLGRKPGFRRKTLAAEKPVQTVSQGIDITDR